MGSNTKLLLVGLCVAAILGSTFVGAEADRVVSAAAYKPTKPPTVGASQISGAVAKGAGVSAPAPASADTVSAAAYRDSE